MRSPAQQAADVIVVQQLEADDAHQEHAADGEAARLRNRHLAGRAALLVEVLPTDASGLCFGADLRMEGGGGSPQGQ